jgi:hypothetical protein
MYSDEAMTTPRLSLVLALALALPCAACASPASDSPYADVVFQGSATDAALTAMLAKTAAADPARAPSFDYPKDLTALPGTPIITFSWHAGSGAATRLVPRPRAKPSLTGILSDLLGERSAYAGGPSMTGEGYLLAFHKLDTDELLFRVFTSSTTYTPDPTSWGKISTGSWTKLEITSASFEDDHVTAGPYEGQPDEFCVGPWQ